MMNKIWHGIISQYRDFLPVTQKTPIVTLLEGNTPLVQAQNLSKEINANVSIYLKYEGLNPTGSFKDRGMTLAISKAMEEGSKIVMCASTGNTSASAAAYAARCGLKCVVLIPEGAIALGKLSQALIHNAHVIAVRGNFDDALSIVRDITDSYPITLVNSLNPYRIEGQKTASFEICDQLLFKQIDYHCIPVGNAGNITAYWRGYREYHDAGFIDWLPKMMGFQAAGSAPIVDGKVIKNPKTIATAIKIGNPASWEKAVAAGQESHGLIDKVTDDEIMHAYKLLAQKEGVFVEPASAASVAGLIKLNKNGFLPKRRVTVACTLTGHGLKDPDRAIQSVTQPVVVDPEKQAILDLIFKK
ncbi:threonine synthase [Chlamydiota bacterium]